MDSHSKLRQIKVLLPAADHDRVRLAAALRRVGMAEFCRQVAVDEANKLTKGVSLPEPATPSESPRRQSRS